MSTSIETLKQWFENEDKPSQDQFWALIDSFFHKTEGAIPINRVEGLEALLNGFATTQNLADYAQGNYLNVNQVGHGFVAGDLVYNDGTSWVAAIADINAFENDSFATNVISEVVGVDDFVVASIGSIVAIDLGFPGVSGVYLSQQSPGGTVDSLPEDGFIQQVGWYMDGLLFFNPQPHTIGGDGELPLYDVETDDYDLKISIVRNRLSIDLYIKDANTNFVIPAFIPAGVASRVAPDYMIETVINNTDSEVLTHRYEFSKLTDDIGPEVVMTQLMDAVGESKRINFRTTDHEYHVDGNMLANVFDTPISMEINPAAFSVTYTGTVSTRILFYADLKNLL